MLVAALVACIPASAEPGIGAKTILLGGTAPLSGQATASAAVARGADAYFKHVNARGGVNGRLIVYRVVDEGSDPAQTLEATRRLVEEDNVFAVVNSLGTAQNVATRDYLTERRVPQLFVGSGATTFGRDHGRYPSTIGFRPSYQAEGWIFGTYLARTKPGAKLAVLVQADGDSEELVAGLRRGIARSKVKLVASQSHEVAATDLEAQIAALKTSGADTLALFTTSRLASEGYRFARSLGWRPLVLVNAGSSAPSAIESSISIAYLKDPAGAAWRADPAMKLYRTVLARYAKGANAKDIGHVHGMAVAHETVRLLRAAGKSPTRAGVIAQLRNLRDASNPFLLPGIAVRTSATERFPIEQARLQRYTKGSWRSFGGLWTAQAR